MYQQSTVWKVEENNEVSPMRNIFSLNFISRRIDEILQSYPPVVHPLNLPVIRSPLDNRPNHSHVPTSRMRLNTKILKDRAKTTALRFRKDASINPVREITIVYLVFISRPARRRRSDLTRCVPIPQSP